MLSGQARQICVILLLYLCLVNLCNSEGIIKCQDVNVDTFYASREENRPKVFDLLKTRGDRHRYKSTSNVPMADKMLAGCYFLHDSSLALLLIYMANDVSPNPGPQNYMINCLYLNARSLVNKMDELQTLAVDTDLIAVTETWLKPDILDCELLSTIDFSIYRCDRVFRRGGGVMLAIRKSIYKPYGEEIWSLMLKCWHARCVLIQNANYLLLSFIDHQTLHWSI